jgi:hypothetical protein
MRLTRVWNNLLALRPDDFIVKPVRHTELLDWLERKLQLCWLMHPMTLPAARAASRQVSTSQARLAESPHACRPAGVAGVVQLGFYRGITNQLDAIVAAQPACASYVETMRARPDSSSLRPC